MSAQNSACEIALLGLGSNLGDRQATLHAAVEALRRAGGVEVVVVSAFIETDPVDLVDQPRFLNAAATIRTSLSPRTLLECCLRIEHDLGRDRTASPRWGARTLDIDLLLFGDQVIDEPGLHVPHPRLHERLFALVPAAEVAGDMTHPVLGHSVRELLRHASGAGEAA